ncbi:MAG: phage tail tape measure protein [Campylobacter sp.]
MAEPVLTFKMELKGLHSILKAVDKSATTLNDKLTQNITAGVKKYNEALKQLKINPIQKAKFHSDLQKLKTQLTQATQAKIRLNMEEAKQKILNLKGEIIATFASVAAISVPIKSAIDFESAMADVKKVVDFKDAGELKSFSNEILKMSQTIPMTAEGLTQVVASGAQMGIAKNDLMKFTDMAAKTAVAFDMTADQAGESIGKIKNILNLSLDETSQMMDAINHLSNNNASKANELVEVMKRIGGIGKQVGITKEQTAALAASFISLGKAPETAASAADAMLKKLNNIDYLSPKTQEAFKKTGLSVRKFKKMMKKDAQGAIMTFLETLNKIDPQKRTGLLSAIMGTNYDSDIATLISGIDIYKKALNEVSDSNKFKGSSEAEFKARSETTANSLQLMKNSFNGVGISIGKIFLPYINIVIQKIANFAGQIKEWVQKNESLVKNIGFVIVSLVGLKTAFLATKVATAGASFILNGYKQILTKLPFDCLKLNATLSSCNILLRLKASATWLANMALKGYGANMAVSSVKSVGFAKSIKNVATAFRALTLAIASNPIGLITTTFAGALLIYKLWQPIKAFFSGIWEGIKSGLGPISDAISSAFEPLKPIFDWVSGAFDGLFSQVELTKESLEGFKNAGKIVGEGIALAIKAITLPLRAVMSVISWIGDKTGLGSKKLENIPNIEIPNIEQSTNGAINETMEKKQANIKNQKTQTINNNQKIDITLNNTKATPQAVADAVKKSSFGFEDEK